MIKDSVIWSGTDRDPGAEAADCHYEDLVRDYLTTHVRFELGERERKGMELFLSLARKLDEAARGVAV